MAAVALRRFSTLPNIPLSYARGGHATAQFAPFVNKYAATEVASEEEEDEEMTSCSDEDMTESLEQEETSTPNTSLQEPLSEGNKRQLVRDEKELEMYQHDSQHADADGKSDDALLTKDLTEWEADGGLHAVEAAFEGTYLLEMSLDAIADWCAPIVWKLFLRQSLSV